MPSAANATYYARRVVDAYVPRTAAGMTGEAEAERNRDLPTADLLAGADVAPLLVSAAEYAEIVPPPELSFAPINRFTHFPCTVFHHRDGDGHADGHGQEAVGCRASA